MKKQIDYLKKEICCLKAIEDFEIHNSVPDWLYNNKELFDSIQYGPDSYTKITSSNCGGKSYENIQSFSNLYKTVSSLF